MTDEPLLIRITAEGRREVDAMSIVDSVSGRKQVYWNIRPRIYVRPHGEGNILCCNFTRSLIEPAESYVVPLADHSKETLHKAFDALAEKTGLTAEALREAAL